jgi:hypothetical protein
MNENQAFEIRPDTQIASDIKKTVSILNNLIAEGKRDKGLCTTIYVVEEKGCTKELIFNIIKVY